MSGIRLESVSVHFARQRQVFGKRDEPVLPSTPALGEDALDRLTAAEVQTGARLVEGDQLLALDHIDLDVADGEAIALLGPSGCGKSTLLRVVAGLQPVASGRVYYDRQDVTDTPSKDRGIGMVFQNYALYPHMEGTGNLGFFFKMHKRDKEIDERVRVTADILGVGFADLLDRKPRQLSGGQQQRVAIGRCIVREPRVFLFDEPLSNLDAKLRATTRVEIKRLLRRFAITTLYVTHDQTEAIALGDRVAVMRSGKIEQLGQYRQLYDHPANVFVASFLGSPAMSLLPGRIGPDGRTIEFGEGHLRRRDASAARGPGSKVIVGFRPEHTDLASGDGHVFNARVEAIEPLHAERQQLLTVNVDGYQCKARTPMEQPVAVADVIPLTVAPENLALFDVDSGVALD